jgi:uncharacterized lipoprotein
MKRWVHLIIGALCLIGVAACSHLENHERKRIENADG